MVNIWLILKIDYGSNPNFIGYEGERKALPIPQPVAEHALRTVRSPI